MDREIINILNNNLINSQEKSEQIKTYLQQKMLSVVGQMSSQISP